MSETIFITKRTGNVITVVNKNALYVVGEIMVEGDKYLVEGEKKPILHINDAVDRLVFHASRV